jgi:hypothetical protein
LLNGKASLLCYNVFDAFATVCLSRGGHFFRPDSSPHLLPAVYLREIQKRNVSGFATLDVCQSVCDNQPLQKETNFE